MAKSNQLTFLPLQSTFWTICHQFVRYIWSSGIRQ